MDLVSALPVPLAGPRTPTRVVGCVGRPTGTPNKQYGGLGGLGFVNDGGRMYRGVRGGRKSNKVYPDECRLKLEHPLEALVSIVLACREDIAIHPDTLRATSGSYARVRARFPELGLSASTLRKCTRKGDKILKLAEQVKQRHLSNKPRSLASRARQNSGKRLCERRMGPQPRCLEVLWELGCWHNQLSADGHHVADEELLSEYISRLKEKIAQFVTMESMSDSQRTSMSHMQVRLKLLCDPESWSTMLRRVKHALGLRSYGIQKATDLDEATRTARALATWQHFDYIVHKIAIGDEEYLKSYVADPRASLPWLGSGCLQCHCPLPNFQHAEHGSLTSQHCLGMLVQHV